MEEREIGLEEIMQQKKVRRRLNSEKTGHWREEKQSGAQQQRNPPGESLRFTDFWGREDGIKQKYHESSMNDVNFKTKMTTFVKSE